MALELHCSEGCIFLYLSALCPRPSEGAVQRLLRGAEPPPGPALLGWHWRTGKLPGWRWRTGKITEELSVVCWNTQLSFTHWRTNLWTSQQKWQHEEKSLWAWIRWRKQQVGSALWNAIQRHQVHKRTRLDGRIIHTEWEAGFKEGRQ